VTATFTTQIELDDRGMAWIAGTKVKVTEVVLDKIAYGSSPEEIHFQHPNLSLAQIHGALTYYYENQDKVDERIRRGLEESNKLALRLSDAEFRRKLLAQEDGSAELADDVLLKRATELGRVLVSQDEGPPPRGNTLVDRT
jgi:uncharacterized protein (DUF433 family)